LFTSSGELARNQSLFLINGVCLPASCSEAKVIEFVNEFLMNADLIALQSLCQTNDPLPLQPATIAVM